MLPSVNSTLDILLSELNAVNSLTLFFFSSIFARTALSVMKNAINALSVLFPPITVSSPTEALLFTPAPIVISARSPESSSVNDLKTLPSAFAISAILSLPSVIVPVLSLNNILRLPAVSRPFNLRTKTLSPAICIDWNDINIEVNIGRPSGTAQTTIVTATVIASTSNLTQP